MISALTNDVYAIGFCNLTGIVDLKTNEIMENIKIIPIDKNMNGRVDSFENIYENLSSITRGVWIGKYPDDLSKNVYAISENRPSDENTLAFLTWLTTDGQHFLNSNGFCDLANIEKQSNLLALTNPEIMVVQPDKTETAGMWVIILISFLTLGFVVTALVLARRNKKSQGTDEIIKINSILDENSILAPKGLFFDRTHTWAFMEQNGTVKIGIDDFLQHITGTLTRIKMKAPGEKIRRGEKIFTINHEGKQLDIFSPVTGTIKEQNQLLTADSSRINTSPYSEGWVYSIEPLNWLREIQLMFMADKYKEWLKDELTRLKDFFAASVRSNNTLYAQVVLQDGGELTDNVLADLGPEVWEEFQRNFINTSK
jgi:glycine cleavage system H lipoate-binding protein